MSDNAQQKWQPGVLPEELLLEHVLIIGQTGSGKSHRVISPVMKKILEECEDADGEKGPEGSAPCNN